MIATRTPADARPVAGATRFARYALAPNELGYCGPDDTRALLEYGATAVVDGGLRELAEAFDGAWPYLQLIAGAHGVADPLDERVVEAYWLGGPLLDSLPVTMIGRSLDERFRRRAGTGWRAMADSITPDTRLSHGFHVFSVYPWVGLLRSASAEIPLEVLDRCRIGWGEVLAVGPEEALVRRRPLTYDGVSLGLGAPITERVRRGRDGVTLLDLRVGDEVSLHWNWVCERLDAARLAQLRHDTAHQLASVNRRVLRLSGSDSLGRSGCTLPRPRRDA